MDGMYDRLCKRGVAFVVFAVVAAIAVGDSIAARPLPIPEMLARFDVELDTDALLHFGPATVANRRWGYGDEDPALFNPTNLDADAIVAVCKEAGLQGFTLVAKHHEGFCLWPTKTTEYNISKSPWKGGKGDIVREFADACRRQGMRFGVYISPWDRNNAHYGTDRYREIYHEQWREIASGAYGRLYQGWFDGANGGDGYYGGAREKRRISGPDYYDFPALTTRLKEWNPGFVCLGGGDGVSNFRYPGLEDGFCDPEARCGLLPSAERKKLGRMALYKGTADGPLFVVPGCDFPQNPDWFYHPEYAGISRSAEFLMKIYLNSVGHGGLMEIGLAPRADGSMAPDNITELKKFGALRRKFFSACAATGVFPAGGGTLESANPFNVVLLREDLRGGERIDGWELWTDGADGKSELLAKGESIGVKRIRLLGRRISGGRIRLVTTKSTGTPYDVKCRLYDVDDGLLADIANATFVPPGGTDLVEHDPMGNYVFSIVVRENAGKREMFAAEELRRLLKKLTGTELSIVTDAQALKPGRKGIFLGRTRFTDTLLPGTDYAKLGPNGYRLTVSDGNLMIAADEAGKPGDGVLKGVYRILTRTTNMDMNTLESGKFTLGSDSFIVPGDFDETLSEQGLSVKAKRNM